MSEREHTSPDILLFHRDLSLPNRAREEHESKMTDAAREVIASARSIAAKDKRITIRSEDMFVAILRSENLVAKKLIIANGVEPAGLEKMTNYVISSGESWEHDGESDFSPLATKVLGLAEDESKRLGNKYVGTHHILLGLALAGDGAGFGVLESIGVNYRKLAEITPKIVSEAF